MQSVIVPIVHLRKELALRGLENVRAKQLAEAFEQRVALQLIKDRFPAKDWPAEVERLAGKLVAMEREYA